MRISDWSSDVCSSDLGAGKQHRHTRALRTERQVIGYLRTCHARQRSIPFIQKGVAAAQAAQLLPGLDQHRRKTQRSEERRVGKECVSTCRSRWSPYHSKKNKTKI